MDDEVRYRPSAPWRGSVVRSRLVERLRQRFTVPVTVVVASAGFGKTTLMHQALVAGQGHSGATDRWLWLGRLPGDRSETPLARLLDAVSAVEADPGAAAERLEGSPVLRWPVVGRRDLPAGRQLARVR